MGSVMIIKKCTVAEILDPSNSYMIEEYAEECSINLLTKPKAQFETYAKLEFTGTIECFGAYVEDKLIGFVAVIKSSLPHYGVDVLIIESIFVLKAYRRGYTGLKLIKHVELLAKNKNASSVFLSAPTNSILSEICPKLGFEATNIVFCKKISNE